MSIETGYAERSKLGYTLFVAMFLVPALAMLIYMTAAVASANIESRTMAIEAGLSQGDSNATAHEAAAWESAALYICPLH